MKHSVENKLPRPNLTSPIHFFAFGFGSGLSPKAPGTVGTLASIPIFYFISDLSLFHYLIVISVVIFFGIVICDLSSKDLKVHDHPGIVLDEFAGFFVTMIAVPVSWTNVIAGFVLFRLFDIWKPWPINWLDQKVSGGFGIMIDDILAGIFAASILHLLLNYGVLK